MIAGLVASPCTSAPLSGALLYVAQSGDLFTGAITLYLLALGMGVPLILITLFGNKILPKSGMWMETVKKLFGFVMLALPVFLISRIVRMNGRQDYGRCLVPHSLFGLLSKCQKMVPVGYSEFSF